MVVVPEGSEPQRHWGCDDILRVADGLPDSSEVAEAPPSTKVDIGLKSPWKYDRPENHVPLPESEVIALVNFVGPHALCRDPESTPDDCLR